MKLLEKVMHVFGIRVAGKSDNAKARDFMQKQIHDATSASLVASTRLSEKTDHALGSLGELSALLEKRKAH